ncbi:uncharacterized protein [Taeniopygia guttata]|uniref:uncharacterized protein isoform X4 n=1 Tax=Taeniopygia guttata TaxID=59729 RepID=UPI003BB98DAB
MQSGLVLDKNFYGVMGVPYADAFQMCKASSLQGSSTSVQQTRHFCGLQGYKLSPECRVLTAYGSHVCFLAKTAKRSLCFIQMGSMQTTNWFPGTFQEYFCTEAFAISAPYVVSSQLRCINQSS